MASMNKLAETISRVANSSTTLNVALAAAFATLAARSYIQEGEIKALEAEKSSLIASNKQIKTTIWSWKENLLSDAALVPADRLKLIYGDALQGEAPSEDENASPSKFVV